MNTLPLTILPVFNRTIDLEQDRSHYLRQQRTIAEHLDPSSSKLTLEVAKHIWAKYSREDATNKSVETEPDRNTNALHLNLEVEGDTVTVSSGVRLFIVRLSLEYTHLKLYLTYLIRKT
jgi:hypothetical protein